MTRIQKMAADLGQARIARRVGVGVTAVNNAISRGFFPASWFPVIRDMCAEVGRDCPESAFNFKAPSSSPSEREAS